MGFIPPPCNNSHGKSSHFFNFRFSLFTPLLVLFLLIVGNSPAWGASVDCSFTQGETIYFRLNSDFNWGEAGAYPAAVFYYSSDSRKDTKTDSYDLDNMSGSHNIGSSNYTTLTSLGDNRWSVTIPRSDIGYIRIVRVSGSDANWTWGNQSKMCVTDAGTNNCIYCSGWDNTGTWETYNEGRTNTCGGSGDPSSREISTDYRLRGDLWAYDNEGNWAGNGHNPELTLKSYKETDGTYTFSYIAPVANKNRFTVMIGGGDDKAALLADGSSSGISTNGAKYLFNVTSSPQQVDITFDPTTNKAKVLISNYTPVTSGWYFKCESAIGGVAANTNTAMAADGSLLLENVAAGTYYFYIHDNASELYWGQNKFGGCYVDQTNSTASLISSKTADKKFDSQQWPIKEVQDRKVKMVVGDGDAGKYIRVAFDGGKITINAVDHGATPEPLSGDYYVFGAGGTNWVTDWTRSVEANKMTITDGVATKTFYNVSGQGLEFKIHKGETEYNNSLLLEEISENNSHLIKRVWKNDTNIDFSISDINIAHKADVTVHFDGEHIWLTAVPSPETIADSEWYIMGSGNVGTEHSLDWGKSTQKSRGNEHKMTIQDGVATITYTGVNGDLSFKVFRGSDEYEINDFYYDASASSGIICTDQDGNDNINVNLNNQNISIHWDGTKIWTNLADNVPAVTYTVTLHPNNGGSNIVRTNVPEGSTTSAAELNLAAVTYGVGTATWYTNAECTTPFNSVTGDMDLYAKWGVSGDYYIVGDLWMYDAGSNWDNNKGQLMTNTNGVSSVTYTAPKGLNRFEIIKERDWGQKINGGNYSAVINASSPIPLSVSDEHIVFTLTEAKQVTITFDGKVSVSATDYSFNQTVDWRVKTSNSGWGKVPHEWDHSNVMTKTASGASIDIFNVPGDTDHSFMITRGSDEQEVVGTYNFNALWLDTSAPSSGLTWKMQNTNIGDRQLAQTDNLWRNCSFRLSAESDLRITFDGGVIRCEILPRISTIVLNESSLDMLIGADFTLNYILTPSDAVIKSVAWSSDNNSIATVDNNGNVHAAGAGTANITCTVYDLHDAPHYATCTVNVTELSLMEIINAAEPGSTITLTHDYSENAVINKAITLDAQGHTIDDLTVEYEGDLTLNSELTVRDFTIWAKAGNTSIPAASGQVRNASELKVNRNAYFLYTVDPSGEVQYGWYDFTVPFPINIVSGIKGIQEGVLKEDFRNGVDYAVMEYFGEKQAQGQYPYKKFSGVMQPKKLYTITLSNYNTLRMQKTADGALVASDEVTLNAYAGDDINKNWNGVGNGTLHHADADNLSAGYVQVYQSGSKTFLPVIKNDYSFVVGTAFMVQETGTMTLSQATHGALLAPSRYESAPATAIQIASEGKPFSDQLFITASETGGQAYTPGVDVAKAGELGSANVPQIWTNAYNSSLCVHEAQLINGKAQYKLSIYAPVAGSYTLTSKNIPADYSLYLTQNGMIVSELSDTYTLDLSKGITTEYGLLLTEIYNSPTGIENTQTDKIQTTKIIRNGVLYILHNGKVYNAQGAKVK